MKALRMKELENDNVQCPGCLGDGCSPCNGLGEMPQNDIDEVDWTREEFEKEETALQNDADLRNYGLEY